MARHNGESALKRILSAKVIAVVGLSRDETKPSHEVAEYLLAHGKTIVAVNPAADEILGQKSYPSLLAIPASLAKKVEIVDVFRKSGDIPQIVKDAIALRQRNGNGLPDVFWMQPGIINRLAAEEALKSGFMVVMGRCAMIEHGRLSE